MNGYAITETPEQALACYGLDGVRHVAELSTGEGFVAFERDISAYPLPLDGATIYSTFSDADGWWVYDNVRHRTPHGGGVDHFGLFTTSDFLHLESSQIEMASMLVGGLILAITKDTEPTAIWSAYTVDFKDTRLPKVLASV